MLKNWVPYLIVINFLCLTCAYPYFNREENEQHKQRVFDKIWNINCIRKKPYDVHDLKYDNSTITKTNKYDNSIPTKTNKSANSIPTKTNKYANSIPTKTNKYDMKNNYYRKEAILSLAKNNYKDKTSDISTTHKTESEFVTIVTVNPLLGAIPQRLAKEYFEVGVNDGSVTKNDLSDEPNKKPLKRGINHDGVINKPQSINIKDKEDNIVNNTNESIIKNLTSNNCSSPKLADILKDSRNFWDKIDSTYDEIIAQIENSKIQRDLNPMDSDLEEKNNILNSLQIQSEPSQGNQQLFDNITEENNVEIDDFSTENRTKIEKKFDLDENGLMNLFIEMPEEDKKEPRNNTEQNSVYVDLNDNLTVDINKIKPQTNLKNKNNFYHSQTLPKTIEKYTNSTGMFTTKQSDRNKITDTFDVFNVSKYRHTTLEQKKMNIKLNEATKNPIKKTRNKLHWKSSPNISYTLGLVKAILQRYVDKSKIDMALFYDKHNVTKLRFNTTISKTHKYDDETRSNNKLGTKTSHNTKNNIAIYKQRGQMKTSEKNFPEVQRANSFRTLGGQNNGASCEARESQDNGNSGEAREGQENNNSSESGVRVWFHRVKNGVKALSKNLTDGIRNIFSSRSDNENKQDNNKQDNNKQEDNKQDDDKQDNNKQDDNKHQGESNASPWNISSIVNFIWIIFNRGVEHFKRICSWIYITVCQYCKDFWNGLSRIKNWKFCK